VRAIITTRRTRADPGLRDDSVRFPAEAFPWRRVDNWPMNHTTTCELERGGRVDHAQRDAIADAAAKILAQRHGARQVS